MRYKLAEDAKPQVNLLIFATVISVVLWVISSWVFPSMRYLFYPLQLFATFVHEGSHALVTLLTGNSVRSLTVSPDTSGVVWSATSGWFSQLLISSAGYLGATLFGTLLLIWIRFGRSSRKALYVSAGFVGVMTVIFGLLAPIWNLFEKVTLFSVIFTVFSGTLLTAGLFAVARKASEKWVNFALSFLAVQCLLNAFFSLKDLFFISTGSDVPNDAANMASATGIPSVIWVFLWIGISLLMISIGLRVYAVSQKTAQQDLPFED
ncbi:MAG TPA: M50 family metallopeptidase [Pyrinomonadaceae bacterium]|jgi:hypothetical protein